jgi:hypothetical protein
VAVLSVAALGRDMRPAVLFEHPDQSAAVAFQEFTTCVSTYTTSLLRGTIDNALIHGVGMAPSVTARALRFRGILIREGARDD